jgi:molybdopterin-binding protein
VAAISNFHFGLKACETPRHSGMDAGMTVVLAKMRIAGRDPCRVPMTKLSDKLTKLGTPRYVSRFRKRCPNGSVQTSLVGQEAVMKISARNKLKGTVSHIKKGIVTAQVAVDIGGGHTITSTVTLDAIDDLGLYEGMETWVVIKASEVILAVD